MDPMEREWLKGFEAGRMVLGEQVPELTEMFRGTVRHWLDTGDLSAHRAGFAASLGLAPMPHSVKTT